MPQFAKLGSTSSHGGVVTTAASLTTGGGIALARVGDLHSCPIPGHGITAILNGSSNFTTEGSVQAVDGSVCGCGAVINGNLVSNTDAPLE